MYLWKMMAASEDVNIVHQLNLCLQMFAHPVAASFIVSFFAVFLKKYMFFRRRLTP